MYRDGKWVSFETSVWWLEVDPQDEDKLVEHYMLFPTVEERQAYIEARIASGKVYGLVGWVESFYGGEPGPNAAEIQEFLEGLK